MLPYTTVYGNRVYLMHSANARMCRTLAIASKCSYEQRGKRAKHDKDFQCGFILPCIAFPYRLYTGMKIIFLHGTALLHKRLIQPQKASYARICNIKPDVVCKALKREMKFASQLFYTNTGEFSKLCFP